MAATERRAEPTTALAERLRELVRVVKLLRQHRSAHRPAIPPGLVGILMLVLEQSDRPHPDGGPVAGCQPKEIARRSGLDPSTVSRAAAALVSLGLVERRPDPRDGRAAILVVTDAGRVAVDEAVAWYADLLHRSLADWNPADVDALTAGIARLVTDLERTAGSGAAPAHLPDHAPHPGPHRALEAAQ
jgi:DNA-binding MarR family transcriptional regulator